MHSRHTPEISGQPSILVVDDTARNIQVLAAVLDRAGYKIAAASNGQKALDMVEVVAPDLILLDVMMPGMDGFEVCEKIKASPETATIPVIMLTARTAPEDVATGFQKGAVDYITKPFNAKELLARVQNHIKLKTARDARNRQIAELKERRSQIHTLSGLLPICSHCKKIRSDEGYWQQLEVYVSDHSDLEFSHGICPECASVLYPDFQPKVKKKPGASDPKNRQPHQAKCPAPDQEAQTPTILIVDDNPKNLQVLGNIVKKPGYRVAAAINGTQALAMIKKMPPDLILLDIIMPELDGLKVCTMLKTAPETAHIPIIMLTAKSDSKDIVKGFEAGVEDYMTKPFNPTELLARVNTHMALKSIRDEQALLIQKLETALAKVNQLSNFIPICANCSKIRDDDGYWQQVEGYITSCSEAEFSHSVCPDCLHKYYPSIAKKIEAGKKQSGPGTK